MHSRHSIRPQYRDYFIDNQAYMTVCLARRDEISSEKKRRTCFRIVFTINAQQTVSGLVPPK